MRIANSRRGVNEWTGAWPLICRQRDKGSHTQEALSNPWLDQCVCVVYIRVLYVLYKLEYTSIVRPLGLTTHFLALTFITVVPFFAGHSFGIVWVQRPSPIVTQLPESCGNKARIYIANPSICNHHHIIIIIIIIIIKIIIITTLDELVLKLDVIPLQTHVKRPQGGGQHTQCEGCAKVFARRYQMHFLTN